MPHAFAPAVAEIKRLQIKLNRSTYDAVFSNSSTERHASLNNAYAIKEQIEVVIGKVYEETSQITSFMRSPGLGLLDTAESLIRLVETPAK